MNDAFDICDRSQSSFPIMYCTVINSVYYALVHLVLVVLFLTREKFITKKLSAALVNFQRCLVTPFGGLSRPMKPVNRLNKLLRIPSGRS